jgi:hypothetical protein
VLDNNGCSLVLVLLYLSHSLHYFSYFHHNLYGIEHFDLSPTSKVNIEHVKSNFNIRDGILWAPYQGLEVTLNNVEANYNVKDGVLAYTSYSITSTSAAKVILKGANSVNGNQRDGFEVVGDGAMDVVVSRGATLNAYNNAEDGVRVRPDASGYSTLTVEKGGAVNACGNGDEPGRITRSGSYEDIRGPASNVDAFFPTSGKRYTCNSVADANGFTCENTCPVCTPK